MPLPGGPASKFGLRYEGRWTVHCVVDVMDEKAEAIRPEAPELENQGFEFWLNKHGRREYHQVKRQNTAGHWTLRSLNKEAVLTNFLTKLHDPNVDCVFISSNSASGLQEVCERARSSESWQEFNEIFLTATKVKDNFFEVHCSLQHISETAVYERIQRIRTENISESFLLTVLESRVSTLVDGEPANVIDVLAEFILEKTHQELTAYDIWNHLERRGFRRRNWDSDPHVLQALQEANSRYLESLRNQAFGDIFLDREETYTIFQSLTKPNSKLGVLVTGEAGIGKSTVLLQVIDRLRHAGIPLVAFRIDRLSHTQLPDEVGHQIGLPGSPAKVIAAVANDRRCVIVIDQLDAISIASGRNHQLLDCVREIIQQAQAHPNVRVLLACRRFDLDHDERLRQLVGNNQIAELVTIERLAPNVVRSAISEIGMNSELINVTQLGLLSVPLHLKLLSELTDDEEARTFNFETTQDLYSQFWRHKQRAIEARIGKPICWTQIIYALCDYMHNRETLSAPEVTVENWLSDADAMISANVLILDNNRYFFFMKVFLITQLPVDSRPVSRV